MHSLILCLSGCQHLKNVYDTVWVTVLETSPFRSAGCSRGWSEPWSGQLGRLLMITNAPVHNLVIPRLGSSINSSFRKLSQRYTHLRANCSRSVTVA